MIKKDLPTHIIKVVYPAASMSKAELKKRENPSSCTRYLYAYGKEDLNECLARAWKPQATAEIYMCNYEHDDTVLAVSPKGVWS